jgi:hypothetical protein
MVRLIKVWSGIGTVAVDGGAEVEITAIGSVFPVNRTFSGTSVRVRLIVAGRAAPDPRLRSQISPVGWQVEVRSDKRLSAEGYARNE